MAGNKRKRGGNDGGRRKQWKPNNGLMTGQGIILTCNRGKERRAANELVDMLMETAESIYPSLDLENLPVPAKVKPTEPTAAADDGEEPDMDELANGGPPPPAAAAEAAQEDKEEEAPVASTSAAPPPAPANDIEAELQAELAGLKGGRDDRSHNKIKGKGNGGGGAGEDDSAGKTAPPFRVVETGTECLIYIQVHPQLDPFELTQALLEEVERTGEARSRIISRLSPVAGFASATQGGIEHLGRQYMHRFFPEDGQGTFKIEPRIRSHNILSRDTIINTLASYIPRRPNGWRCDLKKPDVWVSVEVHKSQAALGACRDFLRFSKLNPLELANAVKGRTGEAGAEGGGKGKEEEKGEEVKGEGKKEEEAATEPAAAVKNDEPASAAAETTA